MPSQPISWSMRTVSAVVGRNRLALSLFAFLRCGARAHRRSICRDPASGYVRRNLSPAARSPIQLVDVVFPPGQRVAYDSVARDIEIHQQVWMIDGVMEMTVGDQHWRLETGDCLAMRLDRSIVYHNPGAAPARYLVALVPLPFIPTRKN
jgi:mannose-6-phosphate isomerase-like protein (cupin superfamily)